MGLDSERIYQHYRSPDQVLTKSAKRSPFSKIKLCQNSLKPTSLAIMTTKEKLIQEIERSPDELLEEFLDFILFVKSRRQNNLPDQSSEPSKP
jgi:hypothetical protein